MAGVVLGFLMARVRLFDRAFEPLFSFGYPIPRVALYPIFLTAFGLGHLSKIALIFLERLYPIAINTYYGTRAVNERYVWAARNMGASGLQVFCKVIVPAALPQIFAGLRIALPVALVIAILTEMIGATEGLGYLRRSGTYVEMGHFVDVGSLQINPNHELMRRNLRLEAVWGGGGAGMPPWAVTAFSSSGLSAGRTLCNCTNVAARLACEGPQPSPSPAGRPPIARHR